MGGEREETVQRSGARPKRRGTGDTIQGAKHDPATGDLAQPLAGGPVQSGSGAGTPTPAGLMSPAATLIAALQAAVAAGSQRAPPPGIGTQKVRMHESKGCIDFHADDDGLKAAVPVGDMWGAWERLQHLGSFTWLDDDNKTLLTILTQLEAGDTVEAYVSLAHCNPTWGPTFSAIDKVIGR